MALCGAKTRSGDPCKKTPVAGGKRCRLHGGKSKPKPAPKANKYAATPGSIYSQYLTKEENSIAAGLELGSVDEELRLTRIRLMRALKRENEKGDSLEVDSEKIEPLKIEGADTGLTKTTLTSIVRDYSALIDKLTARIESLERRRADLLSLSLDAEIKRLEIEKRKSEALKSADPSTNNIMPVPTCDSVEGWEAAAKQQQDKSLGR